MSNWIADNRPLSTVEMTHNAKIASTLLCLYGASAQAIAAMLGNMQAESSINPGAWENYAPFQGGYGLVQWTPYTNYSDWYGAGWENNGDGELARIVFEKDNGLQWIETSEYPMSFNEFWTSTSDSRYLAQVFVKNYERPLDPNQDYRSDYAEYWYDNLTKGLINIWYLFSKQNRWWER